jgi:hypothetical protein
LEQQPLVQNFIKGCVDFERVEPRERWVSERVLVFFNGEGLEVEIESRYQRYDALIGPVSL